MERYTEKHYDGNGYYLGIAKRLIVETAAS